MVADVLKFGRTLARVRAAERLAVADATVAELVRAGCVTSRQAAHHSLRLPWFGRRAGKVYLTAAGRRALEALRRATN